MSLQLVCGRAEAEKLLPLVPGPPPSLWGHELHEQPGACEEQVLGGNIWVSGRLLPPPGASGMLLPVPLPHVLGSPVLFFLPARGLACPLWVPHSDPPCTLSGDGGWLRFCVGKAYYWKRVGTDSYPEGGVGLAGRLGACFSQCPSAPTAVGLPSHSASHPV